MNRYTTSGTALNRRGNAQGLSHASLYTLPTTEVPEPYALLLLGAGLPVLGVLRRGEDVA